METFDAVKFEFWEGKSRLTFRQVARYLIDEDSVFLEFWCGTFKYDNFETEGYFFEMPPLLDQYLDKPFEMALVATPAFDGMGNANKRAFRQHFRRDQGEPASVFLSLGKDAVLICPLPDKNIPDQIFAHFTRYMEKVPASEQGGLWRTVMQKFLSELEQGKIVWMSTDGRGVHWVHLRFDNYPKYTHFHEYQDRGFWNRKENEEKYGSADRPTDQRNAWETPQDARKNPRNYQEHEHHAHVNRGNEGEHNFRLDDQQDEYRHYQPRTQPEARYRDHQRY